jgi:hypothetical protein
MQFTRSNQKTPAATPMSPFPADRTGSAFFSLAVTSPTAVDTEMSTPPSLARTIERTAAVSATPKRKTPKRKTPGSAAAKDNSAFKRHCVSARSLFQVDDGRSALFLTRAHKAPPLPCLCAF